LYAFRACFFLEWGGDTHALCKVLRTKPHWFSGKIVGLIGLVGLVRQLGQLGQLGLACSISPLTSKNGLQEKVLPKAVNRVHALQACSNTANRPYVALHIAANKQSLHNFKTCITFT